MGASLRASDLSKLAPRQPISPLLPLSRYIRGAEETARQMRIYRIEGDVQNQYIYLVRYISLVLETLPHHPEARTAHYAERIKDLKADARSLMNEAETLATFINQLSEQSQKQPSPAFVDPVVSLSLSPTAERRLPDFPAVPSSRPLPAVVATPPPEEPWDVQGWCTSSTGNAVGRSGLDTVVDLMSASPDEVAAAAESRNRALYGLPAGSSPISLNGVDGRLNLPRASSSTLQRHALMPPMGGPGHYSPAFSVPPGYPQVDRGQAPLWPPAPPSEPYFPTPTRGPTLPPQPVEVIPVAPPAPPPPPLLPLVGPLGQPLPGEGVMGTGLQLKPLHVSLRLLDDFLRLAASNTRRNLETCAILAGRLQGGVFAITTLIVPKQEATSDSCSALAEEEIFAAQDERELFSLGWIHTHPSQSCFMSSIDLHTHCAYQTMMDEAVAIVMAPTDQQRKYGIFRLTTPEGLRQVQECPNRGFHSHPPLRAGGPLYETCGHIYLDEGMPAAIVDLRAI